jgi:peroxiredoxin Q/BCP
MKLTIDQSAPDFTLPDQDEVNHTLSDYKGQWILLYFYPKDDTSGCTREACSFRDNFPKLNDLHIKIFGISADSVESHKKFVQKFNLPFSLLADVNKEVVELYDVKKLTGIARSSFLINPEGKIVKIYEGVKPAEHVAQILNDMSSLSP